MSDDDAKKPQKSVYDAASSAQVKIDSNPSVLTRRRFLADGTTIAAGLWISGAWPSRSLEAAQPRIKGEFDVNILRTKFKGEIVQPEDAHFADYVYGELWNGMHPSRKPKMVLRVADEHDVVEAIKYARENKLKVAIRGGGHNWACPSVRNGGMLIDMTRLNQIISIDPKARKAVTQPVVSNREFLKQLNPHGLSFPVGHCPDVKLSGYILAGGLGWNQGTWGPAINSVEAVDVVTAKGELITASATENSEYYWAARGAGPGLFAAIVRYHLKLHSLPKAITTSEYFFPIEYAGEIGQWLSTLATKLPASTELTAFLCTAPTALAEQTKNDNGKVLLISATAFVDSEDEAKKALLLLEDNPHMSNCLQKTIIKPNNFEGLFNGSDTMTTSGLRCKVDAMFYNSDVSDLLLIVREQFVKAPSAKSLVLLNIATGSEAPVPLEDYAYSVNGKICGGLWTFWQNPEEDAANFAWHEDLIGRLRPSATGHYSGESDTIVHPQYLEKSFSAKNWQRLQEQRRQLDPDGLFYDYFEALS